MSSPFLASIAANPPSPTNRARSPNPPLPAGRECTMGLPPSVRARTLARTPRSSRPNFRSTGRAPAKSSQLAPAPPRTPRTGPFSVLCFCIWIYLPLCLALYARRRVSVQRCGPCANPHDHGGMPKSLSAGFDAICAQNLLQEPPLPAVPRHSRRRFDSPSTARS